MASDRKTASYLRRPLANLTRTLEFEVDNLALLDQALTHRSSGRAHNERLEFLGDAALGLVVAEEIYRRFPDADEGRLSRLRASLVNREALAQIAQDIELGEWMQLGDGEMKSGGWRRVSILANALEGLFGAVYLDGGLERCRQLILKLYADRLATASPDEVRKDPKTRLQEFLQSRQQAIPQYQTVAVLGEPHCQVFRVECRIKSLGDPVVGEGDSRRRAEQAAAQRALDILDA